jgi:hypothetical protein
MGSNGEKPATVTCDSPHNVSSKSEDGLVLLPWFSRVVLVVVAVGMLAVLALAFTLRPSERGFGTHEQLGLPPCTVQFSFGIRCPSCGMTTAWSHMVQGQVVQAFLANVGGALSCIVVVICVPYFLVSGVRGRWMVRPPTDWALATMSTVFVVVTLLDWLLRLWLG